MLSLAHISRRRWVISSLLTCFGVWLLRRALRRLRLKVCDVQLAKLYLPKLCFDRSVSPSSTSVKSTSCATSATLLSGVDDSLEPRAEEVELPPLIRSRVLRHISFYDVYDVGEGDEQEVLGEGMNGAVLSAKHRRSGRKVAAKFLPAAAGEQLPEEVTLYLRVSHPNVCRVLQAFVEEDGIWLCMELCSGGELFELAAGTCPVHRRGVTELDTEEKVANLVKQMAAALRYIHSMGIVHRDIKLENWIFASPAQERIKLIDFGLATTAVPDRSSGERKLSKLCGTCYYVAPEAVAIRGGRLCEGEGYGKEVDLWALGVLLYMLISGVPPFDGKDQTDVIWNVAAPKCKDHSDIFQGPRWKNTTPQCRDLISKCLQRDPQKRLTAAGVQVHPWILEHSTTRPSSSRLLAPALKDFAFAGGRLYCKQLAWLCSYLASTVYLSPEMWTLYKELFNDLERLETPAPRGSLSVQKLASSCMDSAETDLDEERLRCLDLTGDGRLHFFEFLGAFIAAGRIKIHDYDVEDAFAACDLDGDGAISAKDFRAATGSDAVHPSQTSPVLPLPMGNAKVLLEVLNVKPPWPAQEETLVTARPRLESSTPLVSSMQARKTERMLSKAQLQLEWQVHRQFAFKDTDGGIPRFGKARSLRRGWATPDPSPSCRISSRSDEADRVDWSTASVDGLAFGKRRSDGRHRSTRDF
eukprot:TRINITY_DN12799_c0_g1_i1.p1 TRINITY_DN12799_c0_g1~~TRINITY_DN12799_c0_g1_i1.p1  ORF type:complete len:705 (+),score=145.23 TRINITY_DN12799_c0_g1_i1:25-2115(+)